jgi:hypothetical protein
VDTSDPPALGDPTVAFYREVLGHLVTAGVPFLVGGAFAYARYTGRDRDTKDLDVFLLPSDIDRTLSLLAAHGYRVDLPFPHWLGKVHCGDRFLDLIFSAGNGVARVDADWFAHASEDDVLGMRLALCPAEEMIWSKAFVQERERFDGADVLHLLRETAGTLNWPRLVARFGDHWPVLLSHLVLFSFVYPDRRDTIPAAVLHDLLERAKELPAEPGNSLCQGTLLSREQYLYDLKHLGYRDARVQPHGSMTRREARIWTDAIESHERVNRVE